MYHWLILEKERPVELASKWYRLKIQKDMPTFGKIDMKVFS